jgi:hypothetical protein
VDSYWGEKIVSHTGGDPGIGTFFLFLYAPISTSHFASTRFALKTVSLYRTSSEVSKESSDSIKH